MPQRFFRNYFTQPQKRRNQSNDKVSLAELHATVSALISQYEATHEHEERPKDGAQGWQRLLEGNSRFASGQLTEYLLHLAHEVNPSKRMELGLGQHPFAVILTCSDSRVSPEIIFDQGLGELFVVRTAGNVPDKIALGSIEYGLLHLKAPLLLVLGHSKCGAVTATLDFLAHQKLNEKKEDNGADQHPPEKEEGHIGNILELIKPAAAGVFHKHGGDCASALFPAIKENVRQVSQNLLHLSSVVQRLVSGGSVSVVTAVYDIDTGLVEQV